MLELPLPAQSVSTGSVLVPGGGIQIQPILLLMIRAPKLREQLLLGTNLSATDSGANGGIDRRNPIIHRWCRDSITAVRWRKL